METCLSRCVFKAMFNSDGRYAGAADAVFMDELLRGMAATWMFHMEEGQAAGCTFLQGRCTLKSPVSKAAVVLQLESRFKSVEVVPEWGTIPDSEATWCSAAKRAAGPWTELDAPRDQRPPVIRSLADKTTQEHTPAPWIPPQFRIPRYNDFQLELNTRLHRQDAKGVLLVVDNRGRTGKSTYAHRLGAYGVGIVIPAAVLEHKDILRYTGELIERQGRKRQLVLFVDLQKVVLSGDQWQRVMSAVNLLKDGFAYSKTRGWHAVPFHWPKVAVFSVSAPEKACVGSVGWEIWDVACGSNERLSSRV